MPVNAKVRVCVLHANVPAILTNISAVFGNRGINIENLMNKSKGENAYTMVETDSEIGADALAEITALDGVRRARVILL